MRVVTSGKVGPAPLLAWGVAALLACVALFLRAGDAPPGLAGWWDPNGAILPRAALPVGATPSAQPVTSAAPIHARVGLQVGHWKAADLPDELAALRSQGGASAAGVNEVDVNLAVARQVAALLTARGVTVDLIPATVPASYRADAFVAIHADANNDAGMRGFKLARFRDSAIPQRDDTLIAAITGAYGVATGLPQDPNLTRAMTGYYAFNFEDFQHAINQQTPACIIEMGFITNPTDRALLLQQQQAVAQGIAAGIVRFLSVGN
ncbi:MAG: N-acetylmuramoyl-L-alanine amidase [Thermomicrobiales bacterium]